MSDLLIQARIANPYATVSAMAEEGMPPDAVADEPERVLAASIGGHFMPGCKDALVLAMVFAERAGIRCEHATIRDICIRPNEGVPMMRNWAMQEAIRRDVDWLFMIDGDFLVEPDVIRGLVGSGKLAVVPWIDQRDAHGEVFERVSYPMLRQKQGIVPAQWVVLSCVLLHTAALRLAWPELVPAGIAASKEEYIFRRLRNVGVRPWINTDVTARMLRPMTQLWPDGSPNKIARMPL